LQGQNQVFIKVLNYPLYSPRTPSYLTKSPRTVNGLIEPFWPDCDIYYDFNWIVTLTISTGWITHVANIPESPPMTKG